MKRSKTVSLDRAAWVQFEPLGENAWVDYDAAGNFLGEIPVQSARIVCAFCGFGPMTTEVPVGETMSAFCPCCGGEHRLAAMGTPDEQAGEAA